MSALIYANTLAGFKKAYSGWNTVGKEGYRAVTFTDDGYIITHGKIFKQSITDDSGTITNSIIVGTDGKLTASLGGHSASIANLVTAGSGISVGSSDNKYTVSHKTFTTASDDKTVAAVSVSDYVLTTYTLKFDKTFGHFTTSAAGSTVNLAYVGQTLSTSTYYLLGSATKDATIGAAVKNASVYVTATSASAATLYAPALNISGGTDSITVGSQTLTKYIASKVDEAKTQAVEYKGTLAPAAASANAALPASAATNGDMYKIANDGYIKLKSDGAATAVELGDTVIYKVTDGTGAWEIIPSGDEEETFIKYGSNGTAESGTITFTGSGVSYSNKTYTFTNTTYSAFGGASASAAGSAGLVPVPAAGSQTNKYLKASGAWAQVEYDEISGTPSIGDAVHTIAIGADGIAGTNYQAQNYTFSANATSDITTYIALATATSSASTWGAVKGKYVSSTSGYSAAPILDGVVYYKDTTYSFSNLTISGKDSSSTAQSITFNSQATAGLTFGDNLTVTKNGTTLTVIGTPNTWRSVYAHKLEDSALESLGTSTGTNSLYFGSEFAWANTENSDNASEIHIVWAEVDKDGNITYAV
jgi:hypothetical protein